MWLILLLHKKKSFQRNIKTIHGKIINGKLQLQYRINKELGKISAFLAGEKTLPSYQSRIIEQAKLTYSPSGKPLEKQTKTTENQRVKQIKAT